MLFCIVRIGKMHLCILFIVRFYSERPGISSIKWLPAERIGSCNTLPPALKPVWLAWNFDFELTELKLFNIGIDHFFSAQQMNYNLRSWWIALLTCNTIQLVWIIYNRVYNSAEIAETTQCSIISAEFVFEDLQSSFTGFYDQISASKPIFLWKRSVSFRFIFW